jgi:hypothetical protein
MNYRSIDYLMSVNDGINPYGFVHHYKRNYKMIGGVTVKKNGTVVKYSDNTLQNKTKEELNEIYKYNEELKTGYEEGDSDYNAIEEEQTQIIDISGRKTIDEFKEETKDEPELYKEFKKIIRPEYDTIKDFQVKKRLNNFLQNITLKQNMENMIKKYLGVYELHKLLKQKYDNKEFSTLNQIQKVIDKYNTPMDTEGYQSQPIAETETQINSYLFSNNFENLEQLQDKVMKKIKLLKIENKEFEKFRDIFNYIGDSKMIKTTTKKGDVKYKYVREIDEDNEDMFNQTYEPGLKYKYLNSVINLDKKKNETEEEYIKRKEKYIEEFINTPGNDLELSICGEDNEIAWALYRYKMNEKSNFQITNFIVKKIQKKVGEIYIEILNWGDMRSINVCFDNIDIRFKKCNEMKDYNTEEYSVKVAYNKKLLLCAYYNLIKKYEDNEKDIEKYDKLGLNATELKKSNNNIKEQLTNFNKFELEYYKDAGNQYYGISITMNKFDMKSIKEVYNKMTKYEKTGVNTDEQIQQVLTNCKQYYRPCMKDRKVIGVEYFDYKRKETEENNKIFKEFSTQLTNEMELSESSPCEFTITARCKGVVAVYNYSKDDLIKDDFILNYYRIAPEMIGTKGKRKLMNVYIPMHKFEL